MIYRVNVVLQSSTKADINDLGKVFILPRERISLHASSAARASNA